MDKTREIMCAGCEPGKKKRDATSGECDVCSAGKFTDERELLSCKNCPKGYYTNDQPSSDGQIRLNRCQGCPRGTWSNSEAVETVGGCIDCTAGKYNDVEGSITNCKSCAIGRYSASNKNTKDSQCQNCDTGKYSITLAAASESDCKFCRSGKYSSDVGASSESSCKNCLLGFEQADEGSAYCLPCTPGEFGKADGDGYSICNNCPNNWYSEDTAQTSCKVCPNGRTSDIGSVSCSLCPAGYMVNLVDNSCTACAPGQYQKRIEKDDCIDCPKGKASTSQGSSSCSICDNGKFADSVGLDNCDTCAVGRYKKLQVFEGNATEIYKCKVCTPGKYQNEESTTSCLSCIPGSHQDGTEATSCKKCPPGKFLKDPGVDAATCNDCPNGFSNTKEQSTSCILNPQGSYMVTAVGGGMDFIQCPKGYYCSGGSHGKKKCLPGSAAVNEGSVVCLKCTPGQYSDIYGSDGCKSCPTMTYTNEENQTACKLCKLGSRTQDGQIGATSCQTCGAGEYGLVCAGCIPGMFRSGTDPDATICKNCPTGFHQDTTHGSTCLKCSPGQYQSNIKQLICTDCPIGRSSDLVNRSTVCDTCQIGQFQNEPGMVSCLKCIPGRYQSTVGAIDCVNCAMGRMTMSTESTECEKCALGRFTPRNASASCVRCSAGRFGLDCQDCPIGFYRDADDEDLTRCKKCDMGEETTIIGSASCSSCDLGRYGNTSRVCTTCPVGQYQDKRKSTNCKVCFNGEIPNKGQTACQRPLWKMPKDCSPYTQYLNNTDSDKSKWNCENCPNGAYCGVWYTLDQVKARSGYWRIPWSESAMSFARCPFASDCLGVINDNGSDNNVDELTIVKGNETIPLNETLVGREGCRFGTTGPLCSLCISGFNRDVNECTLCVDNAVPIRISIFVAIVFIGLFLAVFIGRKVHKKYPSLLPLWLTLLQILSINVTYAQINSSLPSVIDIEWPEEWKIFLRNFSFVNIDIMSLIGVKCIGDFSFYASFVFMVCLPITIVVLSITYYYSSRAGMAVKMATMTKEQKAIKHREALHRLFELADGDQSGHVEPSELAQIIRALGWKIKLNEAIDLAKKFGATADDEGHLLLSEHQFVEAMVSKEGGKTLAAMNVEKAVESASEALASSQSSTTGKAIAKFKKKKFQKSAATENAKKAAANAHLANENKLVAWTLRSSLISASLSGATQLLLLAHTPVSRKAFQYFNCQDLAGRLLMKADYTINCEDEYYLWFMPFVFVVLGCFTLALPSVISFFLWKNRNNLYLSMTHAKVGWL